MVTPFPFGTPNENNFATSAMKITSRNQVDRQSLLPGCAMSKVGDWPSAVSAESSGVVVALCAAVEGYASRLEVLENLQQATSLSLSYLH
ncbi:hypothetical protein [Bradyrhizobium sp. SEMIA]|uniref:hypothetical protein n=1 Tax=Bradyrhizobium sp. SEMIA TaxID=2597515 RepID=UPI0018A359F9|nr:hypothetical protein [Bradyrhizobium sp. SEMIA]QOG19171.1 hypothetical protein FOM02_19290 [Bradyrhizobium sp. SEMIA]